MLMHWRYRKQQPTNAWQNGRNPITARNSSTTPNGTEKPPTKLPLQGQQLKSSTDFLNADKHAHDRSMFLLAQFVVRKHSCGHFATRIVTPACTTLGETDMQKHRLTQQYRARM